MKNTSLLITCCLLAGACSHEQPARDIFETRRAAFADSLGTGTAIIPAAARKGTLNKTFYYLTGSADTSSVLWFETKDGGKATVFRPTPADSGPENTPAPAPAGIRYKDKTELEGALGQLLSSGRRLIYSPGAVDFKNKYLPDNQKFADADSLADIMRVIKDSAEIAALRKACALTAEGINYMLARIEPGMKETDISRLLREGFRNNAGQGVSFLQAAAGENGTSVHAGVTEKILEPGDMAVIDVGAYYHRYTSDISRSFPVNGKFTPEQKTIYEIVLKAASEAKKNFLPGRKFSESEKIAQDVLMEELYRLGLVTDKNSSWQKALYIQHGFSHFIGLDVHDVWYGYLRRVPTAERLYRPGMVITLEPGLYFPENYLDNIPARIKNQVDEKEFRRFARRVKKEYRKYAGIGVRIEDCILITPDGQEVLTGNTPVEIPEIEKLMTSPLQNV